MSLSVCRREAIGSLMGQLQELRSSRATEEARVGSLRRELQDTSQELRESLSRNNRQVGHTFLLTHSGKLLRGDLRISYSLRTNCESLVGHELFELTPSPNIFSAEFFLPPILQTFAF